MHMATNSRGSVRVRNGERGEDEVWDGDGGRNRDRLKTEMEVGMRVRKDGFMLVYK